jgi:hypothetical protein
MISPVSNQASDYVQSAQAAKQQTPTAAAKPAKTEDSVQLSAAAKVDHDGDSH